MSDKHYEVADCPKCGKRDFIDKTDTQWVCLNCGYSEDVSKLENSGEKSGDTGSMWLLIVLGSLLALVALSM
jgi:ribosomal protein S27AE